MVLASDFRLDCSGSTSDATKDPQSACGIRARKIRGWSLEVYHGCCLWKKFSSHLSHNKIVEVEMDSAGIYPSEAEIILLHCEMCLAFQE